ncbi:MAG TPA: hypothetical protein VGN42_17020 [Pirellulales bacterium]|nr:hypothetical protein [Pirellulales bacterium]
MSTEFNQGPGSHEDRAEELGRFGEAPEAGHAWELGAGEEGGASGDGDGDAAAWATTAAKRTIN